MTVNINRLANALLTTSVDTVYTVPTGKTTRIDAIALTNTDTATAVSASVYLVASGGTASETNQVMSAQQIGPGQTVLVRGAIGQVLKQGGTIQVSATAANKINIYASGIEVA